MSRPILIRTVLAALTLAVMASGCSDSKSPPRSDSSSAATTTAVAAPIAAGDFSQLCPALAAFHDPFKDLPPVPSPEQTEHALDALQGGYEVLARLAPPPVDAHIRTSLDALRAYDHFLAGRNYDLNGLEGADRTQHDQLEAAYTQASGVVETEVKAACGSAGTTTTSAPTSNG